MIMVLATLHRLCSTKQQAPTSGGAQMDSHLPSTREGPQSDDMPTFVNHRLLETALERHQPTTTVQCCLHC